VSKYNDTSSLMRCYYVLSSRNLIIYIYIQKARDATLGGRPTGSIVQGCIVGLLLWNREFVALLPIARHRYLSWASWTHFTSSYHISLRPILVYAQRIRMLNICIPGCNVSKYVCMYVWMNCMYVWGGGGHKIWPLHRNLQWSVLLLLLISPSLILHLEWNVWLYLWGRHSSH
jgi:hypothetical protein